MAVDPVLNRFYDLHLLVGNEAAVDVDLAEVVELDLPEAELRGYAGDVHVDDVPVSEARRFLGDALLAQLRGVLGLARGGTLLDGERLDGERQDLLERRRVDFNVPVLREEILRGESQSCKHD